MKWYLLDHHPFILRQWIYETWTKIFHYHKLIHRKIIFQNNEKIIIQISNSTLMIRKFWADITSAVSILLLFVMQLLCILHFLFHGWLENDACILYSCDWYEVRLHFFYFRWWWHSNLWENWYLETSFLTPCFLRNCSSNIRFHKTHASC